jgi:opacity protein-like surface antigen
MNNLKKLVVATVIATSFSAVSVSADDHANEFYFAPEVAYVLPTDGDVDDTVFVGGRVGYNLDENLALEVESGWMEFGWDAADVTEAQNIDVTTVPVIANIRYGQRCSDEEIGWYTFAGVGWATNDLDNENNALDTEIDDSTVWQVGAGLDIPVASSLDAFLDVRYMGNVADISGPQVVTNVVEDEVDLSSVMFTGGLKF